ncbi:MAG: hypothetical protein PVI57_01335 [Gemmatimonadota bacterium]|jgi:hypothetical protein
MKSESRVVSALLVAAVWSLGCGGSESGGTTEPTTTGSLRATVSTTGEDVDPDGYRIRVDSDARPVGASGSVVFQDLSAGSHTVTLEDVSANCAVQNNPRTVGVTAGAEATTAFAVSCEALRTSTMAAEEAHDSLGVALFRILNDIDEVGDLDDLTFEPARTLYEEALALDPENQVAAFGLAITTVFVLEDDPDLRAAADAWDAWLETNEIEDLNGVSAMAASGAVRWARASLPLDPTGTRLGALVTRGRLVRALIAAEPTSHLEGFPPTPAEHQALLRDVVEPALVAAADLLAEIDDPDFTFEVTPEMQGEPPEEADPLELDRTEVLVLQAGLETALAILDIAVAYRAEPSPWGADGFAEAMAPGSTFATLGTDGASRLADAHGRLGDAVDLLRSALSFLESETDDQDDDVIKYDPATSGGDFDLDDYLGSQDLADAREVLDDVEATLSGPRTLSVDLGRGDVDLEVDLTRFFLDPIPDLKALLPAYDATGGRFLWVAETFEAWTFPDPTFNGILPGMASTELLKANIDLEGLFDEFDESTGPPEPAVSGGG